MPVEVRRACSSPAGTHTGGLYERALSYSPSTFWGAVSSALIHPRMGNEWDKVQDDLRGDT